MDEEIDMQVNVRTTGPLPEEFPNRQYVTGVSILQYGHSLVIEVIEPYSGHTPSCPVDVVPCLADGGLRFLVDGEESKMLFNPTRNENVVDTFEVSSSNLPTECREFGGGEEWDLLYEEMRRGERVRVCRYRFDGAPDGAIFSSLGINGVVTLITRDRLWSSRNDTRHGMTTRVQDTVA